MRNLSRTSFSHYFHGPHSPLGNFLENEHLIGSFPSSHLLLFFLISFNLGLMLYIKEPSVHLCFTTGGENIVSFYEFFEVESKENTNCIIKDKNKKDLNRSEFL